MSENFVGVVVGVTVGLAAAHLGNAAYQHLKEQVHQDELAEARHEGYRAGWDDASKSAENIRKRFKEMFGSKEEEADKADKARS